MAAVWTLGKRWSTRVLVTTQTLYRATDAISLKRRAFKREVKMLKARLRRALSRAEFIAVSGSSGKTTTVSLLAHILAGAAQTVQQSLGNGLEATTNTIRQIRRSDRYVVIESGTAKPGQLRRQARLIKPNISIITLVALEHYSAFRTLDSVANEKAELVRALSEQGLAILNFDNSLVRGMSQDTKARVVGFGIEYGNYRVSHLNISPNGELSLSITPPGKQRIDLATRLLGRHNWLAVAAAVTCALELRIDSGVVISRVATFQAVFGRMSIQSVPQGPRFILDTAKAPWFSMMLPLAVVAEIAAPRKRVILGQISDYAGNPKGKYRDAYRAAREVADEVILVGPKSHHVRASEEDILTGRFRAFSSVEACAAYIRQTAIEGEIILIKSAQNLHLERIWLNFGEQVRCWPPECGHKSRVCRNCFYDTPFSQHGAQHIYKERTFLRHYPSCRELS